VFINSAANLRVNYSSGILPFESVTTYRKDYGNFSADLDATAIPLLKYEFQFHSDTVTQDFQVSTGWINGLVAVCDEVTLDLQLKVMDQNIADGQMQLPQLPAVLSVLRKMVLEFRRIGRRGGAGFYDYLPDGTKQLWSDLAVHFPVAAHQPDVEHLKTRFLYIQALEAVRCFEAGVVTRAADADLGSILGVGFPSWTGGTRSFVDMTGASAFIAQCERLSALHGPRFEPSTSLRDRARRAERFHPQMTATGR